MKIPILNGIYADGSPAPRPALPVNCVPVFGENGVSDSHLRPADGIALFATGPGRDRGGIVWLKDGVHYRVMGDKLVSVSASGQIMELGTIPGTDQVRLDYSFDRLAIAADAKLFYWDGSGVTQVVDADLDAARDVLFLSGYFITTDGTSIVVTRLNDPLSVDLLDYGSSEADPDPVQRVLKLQKELIVVNRHTIEVFQNAGTTGFPFAPIDGALMMKGAVGRRAACVFGDFVAFVGGARNEQPRVYLGRNAQATAISTPEIDKVLKSYSPAELEAVEIETLCGLGGEYLHVRLPDRNLVFDGIASASSIERPSGERQVWHVLTGTAAADTFAAYPARNFVFAHGEWVVGHPQSNTLGILSPSEPQHWGQDFRWEFGTLMLRNGGKGAILDELELVALTGAVPEGEDAQVTTSYSLDGRVWSQPRPLPSGKRGDTARKLLWLSQGHWKNWRVQRFCGDSGSRLSALRIEAKITGCAY